MDSHAVAAYDSTSVNAMRGCLRILGLSLNLLLVLHLRGAEAFTSGYISEVLALNQSGLKDEDGDRSGWIEIHNGGPTTLNLLGWFLTDNPTNLTCWRLPGVKLLPNKSLVVFASGKDRVKDLAHLHTNFRLNAAGGYLTLVNRTTNVASEFPFGPQKADVSQGSVRGEPSLRGPFTRPTPGKPNAISGKGFAPEVRFSVTGGSFATPFDLALSTTTVVAQVHYTIDGTLPNLRSPVFTAPISITNSMQVRARAFQDGLLPGPPRSAGYIRLFTNVTEFTSTLPVLVMHTLGADKPVNSHESFVQLTLFEPRDGRTSLTNPPTLSTRAGFRVRGSTSSGMPQSGFAVEFLDDFNHEREHSWLGLPADSDWILYAPNAYDPVLFHNPFVHQLSRDMGRYSPRTRFIEVFLVRGSGRLRQSHYHGICVLEEKIKIGRQRVNIDRPGPEDLTPPAVTGGYVLKFDRLGPGEEGMFASGDRGMVFVEPKEQVLALPQRAPQRQYLTTFFADFDHALNGPDWKDPERGYRAFLDVPAAIDFHVLEVLSGNVDSLVLSTYFHKPRQGKITFGPHWDFDRALGSTDGRDENPRQWNTGPFFDGAWWPRLFTDPDFWQLWVDRWQTLRTTHFSNTNLNGLIDRLAAELREAQPRQYTRWGFQPRGGSYQSEIDHMKDWLASRTDFIDHQLVPPPRLQLTGNSTTAFTLHIPTNATNTTLYYTLDGSDPRQPQGGISSNALLYAGPVQLTNRTRVTARARDPKQRQTGGPPLTTPWSRPVTADFNTAQ